jgi:hypothetical protein
MGASRPLCICSRGVAVATLVVALAGYYSIKVSNKINPLLCT